MTKMKIWLIYLGDYAEPVHAILLLIVIHLNDRTMELCR
jgi:hypothetical protein